MLEEINVLSLGPCKFVSNPSSFLRVSYFRVGDDVRNALILLQAAMWRRPTQEPRHVTYVQTADNGDKHTEGFPDKAGGATDWHWAMGHVTTNVTKGADDDAVTNEGQRRSVGTSSMDCRYRRWRLFVCLSDGAQHNALSPPDTSE